MTTLTITPKIADKTARFKGAVAAGEHVAVTIKGGAQWLGDDNGAHLSLRVLDLVTGRTLAVFPRPPETESEPSASADEWSTAVEDDRDLFCNLNLNTDRMVNAARHMLRVPVLFVMGAKDEANPATTRTLYFRDRYEVEFWPERVGDDTPYDLDKWPKQIDEWTELVTDWNRRMNAMKLSAQRVPRTESSVGKVTITLNDGNAETDTVVEVFDGADGEVTPAQLNTAIAGVNASIENVAADLEAHAGNGDMHVTATQKAAWTAKYNKPSGGIPKSDLADAVKTSLGKADTAIQEHQSLAAYVNAAGYDSNAKKILLKHDSATVAEIDATVFIKDGMVESVEVSGGNLVISFNTDAGVEDIEIPLTDIFNPANYYDKTAADGRFVQKETGKGLVAVDAALSATSENPVQNKAVKTALDKKRDLKDPSFPDAWKLTGSDGDSAMLFRSSSSSLIYQGESKLHADESYRLQYMGTVGWQLQVPPLSDMADGDADATSLEFVVAGVTYGLAKGSRLALVSEIPAVPTKTSQLMNDSGFLTQHQDISDKYDKAGGDVTGLATFTRGLVVTGDEYGDDYGGATAKYRPDHILFKGANAPNKKLTFPSKAGTLALTSDIPDTSGKADTADLRYRIVTPGFTAWTFSGVPSGWTARVEERGEGVYLVITDGGEGYYENYYDPGTYTRLVAELGGNVVTATRGYALLDRASNRVTPTGSSALTLTLPAAVPGYMRDLIVRLDLTALATAPEVTFAAPTGETVRVEAEGGSMPELEAGEVNLVSFTETAPGVIDVAHKTMQEVA